MPKRLPIPPFVFAALLCAIVAHACGAGAIDAALATTPCWLPRWLRSRPAPARRRLLRLELPLLTIGLALAALLAGAGIAAALDAPLPLAGCAAYAVYLAAWLLSLRALADLLRARCERLLSPRAAALTAQLATVFATFPLLWVALQTHRIAVPQPMPRVQATLQQDEVTFVAADGVTLRGTFVRQPQRAPAVVLCHGLAANRTQLAAIARELAAHGCHVLLFDQRGHGASGGFVTTLGAREVDDVVAAATFLRAQSDVDGARIALLGVSMGAATVLLAAERACVRAVWAESAFAELRGMVREQARPLGPLAPFATAAVAWAARCELGIALDDVAPVRALAALPSGIDVALLHAGDDAVVPLAQGRALAAARPGLELQVFAGAAHAGCRDADPARYRERLAAFAARLAR